MNIIDKWLKCHSKKNINKKVKNKLKRLHNKNKDRIFTVSNKGSQIRG